MNCCCDELLARTLVISYTWLAMSLKAGNTTRRCSVDSWFTSTGLVSVSPASADEMNE